MLDFLLHAPRGPFYSPKAARRRWRSIWKAILAFCRVVGPGIPGPPGQPLFMSGALSPSISGATDRCSSGPVGAPDTVWCTPDSPVCPTDRWSETRVARRLRSRPLAAGGIGSPDSPVIYSRTPPSIPESSQFNAGQPGAPDTVRCARPSWSWLHTANSFPFLFCFFCHCF
jgi:hypothetical protein